MGIPLVNLIYVVLLRERIACGDGIAPPADPTARWAYLVCNDRYDGTLTGGMTFDSPPWPLGYALLFAPTILLALGALGARLLRWWSYKHAAFAALAGLFALLVWVSLGNEDDMAATQTAALLARGEPNGTRVRCVPARGGYWEYRCFIRRPDEREQRTSVVVSDRAIVARSD